MRPRGVKEVPLTACDEVPLTATDLAKLDGCLKRHWKRYRKALKRAQKDSSEEPVHNSRVEARRLLAATDLLLPLVRGGVVEKVETLLKRHLDLSALLRDTQVQLLTVARYEPRARGFADFAAFLRKREQRLTRKVRRKLRNAKTGKLEKLVDLCRLDLKEELKKRSAAELGRRLMGSVEQAFARTRRFYTQIDPLQTETIHRTRVSFKKFRYMAEALTELLPGIDAHYTNKLRAHQGLMGAIQDRDVLVETFSRWVAKERPEMKWALRAQEQLKAGSRKLVERYLAQAGKLLDLWPLPSHHSPAPAVGKRKVERLPGKAGQARRVTPKEASEK